MQGLILKSKMFMNKENLYLERQRVMKEMKEGMTNIDPSYELVCVPGEWINAKIVGPNPYAEIIMCDASGVEYIGTFDRVGRYLTHTGSQVKDVVAWMPAPAPYEVRNEKS